jgi:hypothetical protein
MGRKTLRKHSGASVIAGILALLVSGCLPKRSNWNSLGSSWPTRNLMLRANLSARRSAKAASDPWSLSRSGGVHHLGASRKTLRSLPAATSFFGSLVNRKISACGCLPRVRGPIPRVPSRVATVDSCLLSCRIQKRDGQQADHSCLHGFPAHTDQKGEQRTRSTGFTIPIAETSHPVAVVDSC